MKLINQKAELLIQPKGLNGLEKQIEIAARTCYKSENKITEDSAKDMLGKLVNSKHYSMLEHGTVYLKFDQSKVPDTMVSKYYLNPYSRAKFRDESGMAYITTNYRVLKEHGWTKDLQYWCEPTDNHVKRYTFRLTTSIGIVRELLRHRVFSFANESTRYCNYSKDKFNNELIFIIPHWLKIEDNTHIDTPLYIDKSYGMSSVIKAGITEPEDIDFCCSLLLAEQVYNSMLVGDERVKRQPQQAREVLPLCTKSELIMTGFEDDWKDFINVRFKGVTGKPHPDMIELAEKINSALCAEVLANSKSIQILLQNEEKKQKSQ